MHRSVRVPLLVSGFVSCSVQLSAQAPPSAPGTVPRTPVVDVASNQVFDNTKGNLVRHQLGHIAPIAVDPSGATVVAPNNAGQRLTITDLATGQLLSEIPTGPGITALAFRPGTSELWAVDSINHCISVIVPAQQQIVRTIPVGKQPHGIAFLSTGSRAYVSCSADNTVSVVDCAAYSVANTIKIPAMGPRGIVVQRDDTVWLVPLYSGNNTVARRTALVSGDASTQVIDHPDPALGETPLPDRDLLAITIAATPAGDRLDTSRTQTGLGTILFNVHLRPGTSELWIPNTDAHNHLLIGEPNFRGGKAGSNRITIVDTTTFAKTIVDLDSLAAPFGLGCAQPGAVEFSANGTKAYVAGFGSDVVLELDANTRAANAYYRLTAATAAGSMAARCGPRGLVLAPGGNELLVFNNLDNSFSRVDVTTPNSTAPTATPLGYDPTPPAVKRGLGHLANADLSASQTTSCFSCHVDGHFDMLTWDLSDYSDPSGTHPPQFQKDNKGPMATQSLRGLFETGALHWRGERANLETFNDAFVGLLKRGAPLTAVEFDELELATESLVYPANPRQPLDRVYVGAALSGFNRYLHVPADGEGTCAFCHQPPHGTNAEVQASVTTFFPTHATKVAQLRGVQDKLAPPFRVFPTGPHQDRTENGWGLNHGAAIASLNEFLAQNAFPGLPTPTLRAQVAAYVSQFDTGLAPATAWQQTVRASQPATDFANALAFIKGQAVAGHCDAVVFGAGNAGGQLVPYALVYDHVLGLWQSPTGWAAFNDAQLTFITHTSGLTVTFMGMPLGTGRRFAVDRDNDGLLNDDEANFTPFSPADITNPDSDGDGFPDGHEIVNPNGDPRDPNATPQDSTIPEFTNWITDKVRVVYVTSSTAKLEFSTSEPTFASVVGGQVATTSPAAGGFDVNHSILIRELAPNLPTSVTVRIEDPAGLPQTHTFTIVPTSTRDGSHVAAIQAGAYDATTQTLPIDVDIASFLTGTPIAGHDVEIMVYAESNSQPLTMIQALTTATSSSAGVASFPISIPNAIHNDTGRKLHVAVLTILLGPTPLFYFEAKDVTHYQAFPF